MPNSTTSPRRKPVVKPLSFREMLVALELGIADEAVLRFIDLLSSKVPVKHGVFMHAIPQVDLFNVIYEENNSATISNFELNTEIVFQLEDILQKHALKNQVTQWATVIQEGNPLKALLKEAETRNADLLVIGQRSGTDEHGILARNLVRKITGNALIVPEQSPKRLQHILVPIDFSPNSIQALQLGQALAKTAPEHFHISTLNIYELPNIAAYRIGYTDEELRRIIHQDREAAFGSFLKQYAGHDLSIKPHLKERGTGNIAELILEFASLHKVDLIIMGAKGQSPVERLLLGSVTEKLLASNDRIPTLVVK